MQTASIKLSRWDVNMTPVEWKPFLEALLFSVSGEGGSTQLSQLDAAGIWQAVYWQALLSDPARAEELQRQVKAVGERFGTTIPLLIEESGTIYG